MCTVTLINYIGFVGPNHTRPDSQTFSADPKGGPFILSKWRRASVMGLNMPECGQFRAVPTSVLPYEYLDVTRSCDHETELGEKT